jgi:uncharacterized protein (DUF1697 family)
MKTFVALLRAINVGGTAILPMAELRKLCTSCGFKNVATYIQSGNVVFQSELPAAKVQKKLEDALGKKLGKPAAVHLRSPAELASVLGKNPFPKAQPNRLNVWFLEELLPRSALATIDCPGNEEVQAVGREVFVHYPDGMGRSKLKLPFVKTATARNLNTVNKLLALAQALEQG